MKKKNIVLVLFHNVASFTIHVKPLFDTSGNDTIQENKQNWDSLQTLVS